MNPHSAMSRYPLFLLGLVTALPAVSPGAEPDPLAAAAAKSAADFQVRIEAATRELTATRERIARERAPLLEAARTAQDRLASLEAEVAGLDTSHGQAEATRQRLQRDGFALLKNVNYVNTLARDSLRSFGEGLLPGEAQRYSESLATLGSKLEGSAQEPDTAAALATTDLLLSHLQQAIGGSIESGESVVGGSNAVLKGSFVFVGPEVYFQSADGAVAGTVRSREGAPYPNTYLLPGWTAAGRGPLFRGEMGSIMADASGGKSLRLRETTGTLAQHIDRGGPVAYLIIGVGIFALGLALQKAIELRRLAVDSPAVIQRELPALLGPPAQSRPALGRLRATTRELFDVGLRYASRPRETLEEHLFAFTLRQRLHYERRLPLLAVIATASPLMGLLGTVMGMIKTFALITVFGTGNAAKLSSGISEVLVTTELGLVVAIPALVAHGFLSHRTQRKLSLLERYAVEFTAAVGDTPPAERDIAPVSR